MGVHGLLHLLHRGLTVAAHHELGDELGGMGPDDVGPEYFLSRRIVTKPSAWPAATARPMATHGSLPTSMSYPCSLACSSVSPTEATSGWQYVQLGTFP